jgi:hypothetical protein
MCTSGRSTTSRNESSVFWRTSDRKLKTVLFVSKSAVTDFATPENVKSKATETDAGDRPHLAAVALNTADAV